MQATGAEPEGREENRAACTSDSELAASAGQDCEIPDGEGEALSKQGADNFAEVEEAAARADVEEAREEDLREKVGGVEWSVCWLLLATAVQSARYDSRARGALRRVCRELGVPWQWLSAAEVSLCSQIVQRALDAAQGAAAAAAAAAGEEGDPTTVSKFKRWGYIGGGAVLGGIVFAVSGGLAVPAVLAAGALCGAHVALGAGTITGLTTVVSVSFGGYGAGLVGKRVAHRIGDVEEFELDIVDMSMGLPIVIGVPGWLNDSQDNAWKVWDNALCDATSDGGDALALRFDTRVLYNLGNLLSNYLQSKLQNMLVDEAGTLVLGAAYASLALPQKLISWSGWIDNTWAMATRRGDQAGEMLANLLASRAHGHRPVTLIGFGIGARLIFKCLLALEKMGNKGLGIVESSILLGAPVSADVAEWSKAAKVCGYRLVNGYCRNDWVLGFVYRAGTLLRTVAGLRPITADNKDITDASSAAASSASTSGASDHHAKVKPGSETAVLHPAIENLDLTSIITGHWNYRDKLPELVKICGLATGVSTPPPPAPPVTTTIQADMQTRLEAAKGRLKQGMDSAASKIPALPAMPNPTMPVLPSVSLPSVKLPGMARGSRTGEAKKDSTQKEDADAA